MYGRVAVASGYHGPQNIPLPMDSPNRAGSRRLLSPGNGLRTLELRSFTTFHFPPPYDISDCCRGKDRATLHILRT